MNLPSPFNFQSLPVIVLDRQTDQYPEFLVVLSGGNRVYSIFLEVEIPLFVLNFKMLMLVGTYTV